jgi:UPF0271 protein
MQVDLNADVGESFGIYRAGNDSVLLEHVTSASIACGYHAGDPCVMRRTVVAAARAGVAIGAHPSFPDLVGFGRRDMKLTTDEITDLVLYQIGALSAIARAEGMRLQHVKPHGALYNMSVRGADIGQAIARAVASFDDSLILIAFPGSELQSAGSRLGLRVAAEGFADRSYDPEGSLTPRHLPDAVLVDPRRAAEQAVAMVRDGRVRARDGSTISQRIDTICIHGDTASASEIASVVRSELAKAGATVAALGTWIDSE